MKQLEQEAHRAAGQIFLLTSNTQLRTVRTFMCTSGYCVQYMASVCVYVCIPCICKCLYSSTLCVCFMWMLWIYNVCRFCLRSCVFMSAAKTRSFPRPSANSSSQHLKLQYDTHVYKHRQIFQFDPQFSVHLRNVFRLETKIYFFHV